MSIAHMIRRPHKTIVEADVLLMIFVLYAINLADKCSQIVKNLFLATVV